MRLLNVALIILTALATLAGYLQEKKRLATIRALPAARARDLYDVAQKRRERVMIAEVETLLWATSNQGIATQTSDNRPASRQAPIVRAVVFCMTSGAVRGDDQGPWRKARWRPSIEWERMVVSESSPHRFPARWLVVCRGLRH